MRALQIAAAEGVHDRDIRSLAALLLSGKHTSANPPELRLNQ
jgi:hypothetical protein